MHCKKHGDNKMNQPQMPKAQSNKENIKKQKKAIIIIFICLIGFVLIYSIISMIDWSGIFTNQPEDSGEYIYFYDEKLSQDLASDETYMSYDRTVNLLIEASGISETITEEDRAGYNEAINLLYSMIEYITIGNAEAYNSCFSSIYFSKADPIARFTKQKIYNITIIEVSQSEKADETGNIYTEYYYKLDYMIRHNNGSLRKDVGSDGIKTQHIILSDRTGDVLIDTIYTLNYINKS